MAQVHVRVNNAAIQGLFAPDGPVGREGLKMASEISKDIKITGPARTGRLRNSFSIRGAMAKYSYKFSVSSRVPYAPYVVGGTERIYPKNGAWLRVPRHASMALAPVSPRGKGQKGEYTFKHSVRGQKANPFHARSAERVLRAHGFAVSFI